MSDEQQGDNFRNQLIKVYPVKDEYRRRDWDHFLASFVSVFERRMERLEEYVEADSCGKTDEILEAWRKFKAEHGWDNND